MLRVYCDTNVIIDYFENRNDKYRPLGNFAFDFFSRGLSCLFTLVISTWTIEEARKLLASEKLEELFNDFREKNKFVLVDCLPEDRILAKNMSSNWTDALHVVLAKKGNSDIIATGNIKHFAAFSSMIDISRPERI